MKLNSRALDICTVMGFSEACQDCGDYSKWQPCNENIPDHIPNGQIRRYINEKQRNYLPLRKRS